MKPFTIRKAVVPGQGQRQQEASADAKFGVDETADREVQSQLQSAHPLNSNLTEEELDLLKPKTVQVVNPWIHEQTHKEYLENITVSRSCLKGLMREVFQKRL